MRATAVVALGELSVPVPGDAEHLGFELTLAGPGQAGLRNVSFSSGG